MNKGIHWVMLVSLFLVFASTVLVFGGAQQESQAAPEKVTVHLISHRYPALEFYAEELKNSGIPGVDVETKLVPWDKAAELGRMALSAGGSSPYEIVYVDPTLVTEYAEKGWLEPLDDFIKKYNEKYNFDDIPDALWDMGRYNGKIYAVPIIQNVQHFFYRSDLFTKYGLEPPKTLDQWLSAAQKAQGKDTPYGTTLTFGRLDGLRNDFHGFFMAYDGEWYDSKNHPLFNKPEGTKAVTMMKDLMKYAPPEVLTYFNDQAMVAMQQGMVAMGNQWATRAAPMDKPDVSKVVGLMQFAPAPSGRPGGIPCAKLGGDLYAIPKNIGVSKDLVFRVIAEVSDEESMLKALQYGLVPRTSVTSRPDLIEKYRFIPAAMGTIEAGAKLAPTVTWTAQVDQIVTLRVSQALAGEMKIQEALDLATKEVVDMLKEEGKL